MQAETKLMLNQPYPGDECYNTTDLQPEMWFKVIYRCDHLCYMIHNQATQFNISIPKLSIANPKFNICQ